ncbi:hypothetical protein HDU96_000623 [Phlyctochytrium bullatum]|nr:hypothetical protein HDU96_000623 [Phlyctochytrium bullatum]
MGDSNEEPSTADPSFPFPIGFTSIPGRKHVNPNGLLNEDAFGFFSFTVDAAAPSTPTPTHLVSAFYVLDGHGEASNNRTGTPDSPARQFVGMLAPLVEAEVKDLVGAAVRKAAEETGGRGVKEAVLEELAGLKTRLQRGVERVNPVISQENGSTLALGIVFMDHVFFASIGDSSMLLVDPDSAAPLKVWSRHGLNDTPEICSYEDSLTAFPFLVKEGQTRLKVSEDYKILTDLAKIHGGGPKGGFITSVTSPHRLGMTNTLGNCRHQNNMLPRTTVYGFSIDTLLGLTKHGRLYIVVCSDGVKDTLKAEVIARCLGDVTRSFDDMSNVTVEPDGERWRAAIQTLVGRRTADPYDPALARHFEDLLAVAEGKPPPVTVAISALCDVALLRGSLDDATALGVEIRSLSASADGADAGEKVMKVMVRDTESKTWVWSDAAPPPLVNPLQLDIKPTDKN